MAPNPTSTRVDLFYWTMMLSACCMGEAVADFLSRGPMNLGYARASIILIAGVCISLYLERSAKRAKGARYWAAIIMMSTAGTTIADYLSRTLTLGYLWSTLMLIALFGLTFLILKHSKSSAQPVEKSMPTTDARYWMAIMVASTLGTTAGDALTNGTKLGFGGGTAMLAMLLAVTLFYEYGAKNTNEARYWIALILASTIGATSGDFVTNEDGLNLGYYWGIGAIIMVFLIVAAIGNFRSKSENRRLA